MRVEGFVASKIRGTSGRPFPYIAMCCDEREKLLREKYKLNAPQSVSELLVQVGKTPIDPWLNDIVAPTWLQEYIDVWDSIAHAKNNNERRNIKVCSHVPPQHGKTVTTLTGIVYCMMTHPGSKSMYISYNGQRATDAQAMFVDIVRSLGFVGKRSVINMVGKQQVQFNGATCYFRSKDANITGYTVNMVMVLDDMFAGYNEAAGEDRESTWITVQRDIMARSKGGMAFVCNGTRMGNDDVHQRLLEQYKGFRYVRIPAINIDKDGNECALNEEMKPLAQLQEYRTADPLFELSYQGNVIEGGVQWFHEPTFYRELPPGNYTYHYGCDLAYSGRGDLSILVEVAINTLTGLVYVTRVWSRLCVIEDFIKLCANVVKPGCVVRFYGPINERSNALLMEQAGVNMNWLPLKNNAGKAARAKPSYLAWNVGTLLVLHPDKQQKVDQDFVLGVKKFTDDPKQKSPDFVDALAAAYDEATEKKLVTPIMMPGEMARLARKARRDIRF